MKLSRAITLLCFSMVNLAASASSVTTNCKHDEEVLFSCTSGTKIVSYCTAGVTSREKFLEYRFSSRGKTELTYRVDANARNRSFSRTWVEGASSSSTALWFTNAEYTYVLNDPIKGTPFVEVLRAGKQVSLIQCKGNIAGDSEMKSSFIDEATREDYLNLFRGK